MKKLLLTLGTAAATVGPLASVVACGGTSSFTYTRGEGYDISAIADGFGTTYEHGKVMSSYWTSTDMYAALGYIPEYASLSGNKIYADYLKPWLGDNNDETKISEDVDTGRYTITSAPTIMDGQQVDRETIASYEISTLLLNEWEQVDEHKFHDIVPALIYTTMADGYGKRESGQDLWEEEKDVFEAYYMQAKGMDRAYPDADEENKYFTEASSDVVKLQENIKAVESSITEKESVMVIDFSFDENNNVEKLVAYGTLGYNVLYSKDEGYGIGMEFPTTVEDQEGNINKSGWSVTADDVASFTTAYAGQIDNIIVNESNRWTTEQVTAASDYANNDANFAAMLSAGKTVADNITVVDRTDWYEASWGIMGTESFIETLNGFFGSGTTLPNQDIFGKNDVRTVMTPEA